MHDAATNARHSPPPLPSRDERWALFLDLDGTLIELAETPDAVRVPGELPARLEAIGGALDHALALVSGRSLATLDSLLAPLRAPAAGLHGIERRDARGHVQRMEPDQRQLDEGRRLLQRFVVAHPAALLEDKGASLALHYRRDPALAEAARSAAADALSEMGEGFHLQPGHMVVEIKSRSANKGGAIAAFLDEAPFAGRRPVFLGDDATDEHGFEVATRHGGFGVLVGQPRDSAATHHLANPAAVHAWLAELQRHLGA